MKQLPVSTSPNEVAPDNLLVISNTDANASNKLLASQKDNLIHIQAAQLLSTLSRNSKANNDNRLHAYTQDIDMKTGEVTERLILF